MWIVFALLAALAKGHGNVLNKMGADRVDPTILTWLIRAFGMPFWIIAFLFLDERNNTFSSQFFIALAAYGVITTFASILRFKSFSEGDVSHIIPLGNLIPVLVAVIAYFTLNEQPSALGWAGIAVILGGAYTLNISSSHTHWLDPIRDLFSQSASRKFLIVVLLLAISVAIDKVALDHVSVYAWGMAVLLTQCLFLTPSAFIKRNQVKSAVTRHFWILIGMAAFSFAAFFFQLLSFASGGLIGLSLALKRLDSLVTIVLAGKFLKEKNIRRRLASGTIMAAGAVLIALS